MIILKIQGGLGNQMFQYAAGRNLSIRLNTEIKLDISSYNNDVKREYELKKFRIKDIHASQSEIAAWRMPEIIHDRYRKRILWYLPFSYPKHFREKEIDFDSRFLNIHNNCYVEGYFQSKKYFLNSESILRKEFVKKNTEFENKHFLSEIDSKKESVSIHIRRGDYISEKKINNIFFVCDLNYYQNAINYINDKLNNPTYFVFSDDLDWARDNLIFLSDVVYIDYKDKHNSSSIEEIILMSKCKNHIISNSSFSWWGTWLCQKNDQVNISPKKWDNTKIDKSDLIENFINL